MDVPEHENHIHPEDIREIDVVVFVGGGEDGEIAMHEIWVFNE